MGLFDERLRTAMADLNITQAKFAEITGKSKASICQYLNGHTVPPKKTQERMAVMLGLQANYFYADEDGEESVKNMPPEQAAKMLGVNVVTIRKGLQQGVFPWGYAVKTTEDRWTYIINARKFYSIEGVGLHGKDNERAV